MKIKPHSPPVKAHDPQSDVEKEHAARLVRSSAFLTLEEALNMPCRQSRRRVLRELLALFVSRSLNHNGAVVSASELLEDLVTIRHVHFPAVKYGGA